jgi:hypothetical protein
MKMKGLIYALILLMIVSTAFALSADDECKANGYSYGIAKYTWNAQTSQFEVEPQAVSPPDVYDIKFINGKWDAFPSISGGVLITTGGKTTATIGGGSGIIPENTESLTFCGNNFHRGRGITAFNTEPTELPGVPEFSVMTLGLAIVGVGLGLAFLRKH